MGSLADISHLCGSDVELSASGDLAPVTGLNRSTQRVLRRLLTVPGAYRHEPGYGGGLATYVGTVGTRAAIVGVIRTQMLLEPSVLTVPAPTVTVAQTLTELSVSVNYVDAEQGPQTLAFTIR